MNKISFVEGEIKEQLQNISAVNSDTIKNDRNLREIEYLENPLNPNLFAYCFDVILGFKVRYRIEEKVNYIIEFDYRGTYGMVKHSKMSYRLFIDREYSSEFVDILSNVKLLLERLFISISEGALSENKFSLKNESPEYYSKLSFYEKRIESLEERYTIIQEKCKGLWDTIETTYGKSMTPKGQKHLKMIRNEIKYDIEAYIDTFYSTLEHTLTLLYPFINKFSSSNSYYRNYIRNTRWSWEKKIQDVCGATIPNALFNDLKRIKEVYRNHNAHGGFSREMMAYVIIPNFGQYPLFIGKEYLKGFALEEPTEVTYEMYIKAKEVFNEFFIILDKNFEIPMMFIKSGLPISMDINWYNSRDLTTEKAQWIIDKIWYDIDNQYNMDW